MDFIYAGLSMNYKNPYTHNTAGGIDSMIFYFSGTGNSKWAAEQIAELTGDEARDITKPDQTPDYQNERQIGLVFPIYAWGAPEAACSFAKTLGKTKALTFAVCTCGSEAGYAMRKLKLFTKILFYDKIKRKNGDIYGRYYRNRRNCRKYYI